MRSKPRLVFDTNVLLDAICFPSSFGRQAYVLALRTVDIMMSEATLHEVTAVLQRPKFDRFVPAHIRYAALAALRSDMTFMEPWCHYRVCRDATDDKFIDLAVCAGAEAIISRDADLLALTPCNGIRIEDARQFVLSKSQRT
ncbi:MAG: putative toxin-antitoxin system toxin component, PIN family [Hyphomicrobiaceae bacterium]